MPTLSPRLGLRWWARFALPTLLFLRHPDHVARATASAGGADVDFIDVETCASKALGECRVGSRRPDGEHAPRPQRRPRRLQPTRIVERIVAFPGQPFRPVVDVKAALVAIYREKTGSAVAAGARWIEDLGAKNRYVLDVWAGG